MPRAELPAIIPLRQFGEDTWLAPGFIEPVGDARASFALNGETVVVRDGRCARADGRLAGACLAMASAVRNCVRLLSVPLTTALRFASTHPAEFSASATGLVSSRRDIAPTWSRSTAPRSRFSTPGSPAPAASASPRSTRYSRPFVPAKAGTSRFIAMSRSPSGFSLARE
jgi:hypothetical protein